MTAFNHLTGPAVEAYRERRARAWSDERHIMRGPDADALIAADAALKEADELVASLKVCGSCKYAEVESEPVGVGWAQREEARVTCSSVLSKGEHEYPKGFSNDWPGDVSGFPVELGDTCHWRISRWQPKGDNNGLH